MPKALLVRGGWEGHEPMLVSVRFRDMLEREGYAVTISDTLDCWNELEPLLAYDLIVPIWTMSKLTGEQSRNICEAVARGVGIAGCHGGMCDAFREDTNWQFMTGGQWVAHPGNDGTPYRVNLLHRTGHPILEGIEDFDVCSEQYYVHVDPANGVLATTRFPTADGPHAANGEVDVPVAWTRLWGKGRVFYNSLGHHDDVFDIPQAAELMRRGLLWATRRSA